MPYQQKSNIVNAELEGQVVLLHPDNGRVLVLNEAGSYIWHIVRHRTALETVVQGFTAVYHSSEPYTSRDIAQFLQTMTKKGLLDET